MTRRVVPLGFALASAARSLYASEGSVGFSIRRLAKRVGASSAALYDTWPSREALLDCVAWQAWESFRRDLGRHDGLKPQRARLAALTADAIDFALANPHLWDLMLEPKNARCRHAERVFKLFPRSCCGCSPPSSPERSSGSRKASGVSGPVTVRSARR